jgi:glycosyltransferase involved in cell wall biosynthesis
VLFDAHQIGTGQAGNETYARELLGALRGCAELEVLALAHRGTRDAVLGAPVRVRRVPRNGWLRLVSMGILGRRRDVDVVHSMYYQPPLTGRPTVVSIHDVSFERFPEFFSRRQLVKNRLLIREAARRASMVVTISHHARREIVELYGVDPDRVAVVPGGVARAFLAATSAENYRAAGDPLRILSVGTLEPRKNLLRLIEAVDRVRRNRPVQLRVVGPAGHQAREIRARLGERSDVQLLGYVSERALVDEYRSADIFAYPSVYEGFGLPVVEAMACGTPVMTSSGGSLPEVAGDAALVVNPNDVDGMAAALDRLGSDESLRQELRRRGLARAAEFSWEASARELAEVYRRTAGG